MLVFSDKTSKQSFHEISKDVIKRIFINPPHHVFIAVCRCRVMSPSEIFCSHHSSVVQIWHHHYARPPPPAPCLSCCQAKTNLSCLCEEPKVSLSWWIILVHRLLKFWSAIAVQTCSERWQQISMQTHQQLSSAALCTTVCFLSLWHHLLLKIIRTFLTWDFYVTK